MKIRGFSIFLIVSILLSLVCSINVFAADIWYFPLTSYSHIGDGYGCTCTYHNGEHRGIDIVALLGTPVRAAQSGTIERAYYGTYEGNYILIRHSNGMYTAYKHLNDYAVKSGYVSQGQIIGYVGSTGDSTGYHLHFEMGTGAYYSTTVNPLNNSYACVDPNNPNGIHKHSYTEYYEAVHPHRIFMKCSCGDWDYTGTNKHLASCNLCTTSADIPNGTYAIRHTSSGKYISMRNTTENINTVLYQPGLGNGVLNTDQMLIFERQSDNSYSIKSAYSGKVLDVPSYDVGAGALQAAWHGGDSQRWYITTVTANGDYQLVNKCTGLTLDVYNNESADLTKIQQFNNHGGSAQRFRIVPVTSADIPNGVYVMENAGLSVVPTYNAGNGRNVFMYPINYFSNGTVAYDQRWEFIRLPDNSYKIMNVWRQEALDVQGAGTDKGTNVQVYPWWNHDAQHWYIIDCGGTYMLVAKHSGLALDVDGSKGPAAPLTNVQTWIINGTNAQRFTITPVAYAVIFDANGGTGAPEIQYKTHGVALTLSTVKPTRAGYRFLGWATNASAAAPEYQPGGSDMSDMDITFYAVWAEETFQEDEYDLTYSDDSLIRTPNNTISGSVSYNVNKTSSGTETGTVICGIYDKGGRLAYISMKQNVMFDVGNNPDSFTGINILNATSDPYIVKIMVWSTIDTLEPLTATATFELS